MQPDIGLVFQASTFCLDLANINQIQMYTCYALYLIYRQPLLPFVSPPVAFHIIRVKFSHDFKNDCSELRRSYLCRAHLLSVRLGLQREICV